MSDDAQTYTAVFMRDSDGYWLVELREEPRVHTFGRTLEAARAHIADAANLWFERDVVLTEARRRRPRSKGTPAP